MDLHELHERTGIDPRKLRYCLDHSLIPGFSIKLDDEKVGRPRSFAPDVGFAIVCAAELVELGLPHRRIRRFLEGMRDIEVTRGRGAAKQALLSVLEQPVAARAQLGDGVNVRIVIDEHDFDSGWIPPSNRDSLVKSYRPVVVVTLDIGHIRERVFREL